MAAADHHAPMRVLMTADTVGGVWTYAMDLCRALAPYGVRFHLVTMGASMQPWQRKEVEALDHVTVYETTFRLEWMEDPWEDVERSGAYLRSLEGAIEPDIIHLNGYAHAAMAWKTPVISVAHSDVYSWFSAVKQSVPGADWDLYYNRVKDGLMQADHVVAPSNAMMDEIRRIYGDSRSHSVIYNARAAGLFAAGKKESTIMCMGRIWDEAKNVRLIVEAAHLLRYPVRIAGENQFEHNSVSIHEASIVPLGKLGSAQVAAELASAGIYCLPARYEPFGLSVLEAALSGCALVLGDIPSLREIWGDAAIYVDTANAEALAACLNTLMEDPFRLRKMAAKAGARAAQFSTEKLAAGYLDLYRGLIAHKSIQLQQNTSL